MQTTVCYRYSVIIVIWRYIPKQSNKYMSPVYIPEMKHKHWKHFILCFNYWIFYNAIKMEKKNSKMLCNVHARAQCKENWQRCVHLYLFSFGYVHFMQKVFHLSKFKLRWQECALHYMISCEQNVIIQIFVKWWIPLVPLSLLLQHETIWFSFSSLIIVSCYLVKL